MRLLHVIASTTPVEGGPIEHVRQAAQALHLEGHVTEIACLDPPDAPWLRQLPCKTYALGPGLSGYRYSASFSRWIRHRAESFDCVIAHGLWNYTSVATWLALRRSRTPYFIYPHGMLDPFLRATFPLKHIKKAVYWSVIERRVLRDARAVMFASEGEQHLAKTLFRSNGYRSSVVGICVASPSGAPEASREAFLVRFPRLRGKRLVLFLSRLHPKKGCDLLISAFARTAATDERLELVMAGPDIAGWEKDLRELAKRLQIDHRITWTGGLVDDLKWSALRAAEVFVLPTHQENFGIAIVEALACGTPPLITDRVSIWREIQQDGAGLVGSPDVDSVVDLLQTWLKTPITEQNAMRARARKCYATRYRREAAAKRLIDVLRAHHVQG